MTPLMAVIPTLNETEKIQLISAASERILYPKVKHGLRYYGLDSILSVEADFDALTPGGAKELIRAIVNHI